jgi:hypothetical protein
VESGENRFARSRRTGTAIKHRRDKREEKKHRAGLAPWQTPSPKPLVEFGLLILKQKAVAPRRDATAIATYSSCLFRIALPRQSRRAWNAP